MTVSSQKLYGREINLVIGSPNDPKQGVSVNFNDHNATGLDVSGFDIEFQVEKNLKPEPNTCAITIYNLREDSRKKLSGVQKLTVRLEAGYKTAPAQLFLGEARAAWTERKGPDFVTHIESGDSEKEVATARLVQTIGASVPVGTALQQIARTLGVGLGNIASVQTKGIASINGAALTGPAARRLTDFCRSAGLEWSIQDGALQILNLGHVLSTTRAIELSAETGLIESPSVDSKGIVTAQALLIPGLVPGCLVKMSSLFVQGGYRVERCRYHGSTFGPDWTVDLELKKY